MIGILIVASSGKRVDKELEDVSKGTHGWCSSWKCEQGYEFKYYSLLFMLDALCDMISLKAA